MAKLKADLEVVEHNIENIVDFAIAYFTNLKDKYGKGRERKTKKKLSQKLKQKLFLFQIRNYM